MDKFFTTIDGQVWINKNFLKNIIRTTQDALPDKYHVKRFADLMREALDACVYEDNFYCGSCRMDFPVVYKPDDLRADWRPCPRCGSQATRRENNAKKSNSES